MCCETAFTYRSAWADDDTWVHALLIIAIGTLSAVSTLVLLKVLVLRHGGLLLDCWDGIAGCFAGIGEILGRGRGGAGGRLGCGAVRRSSAGWLFFARFL